MKNTIALLLISLCIFSCSENDSSAPTSPKQSTSGGISLAFEKSAIPANVVSVIATLSRDGYVSLKRTMNFLTDTSAEVLFDEVAVGTWDLNVKAFSIDSVLLYQGSAVVIIQDGQTTIINLKMEKVVTGVGSVQIYVSWGTTKTDKWIDNPSNPVLSRQNTIYDGRGVGYPIILKDSASYKMYYTNTGSTPDSLGRICTIGLATSTDGNSWTHYSSTPVLLPTPGAWDSYIVTAATVLKEGNTYKMFYVGMGKGEHSVYAIGLAASSDGIHWEKRAQPIFQGNSGWENYNAGTTAILKVNGEYRMYYTGYPVTKLGYATSPDGITWTRQGIAMEPTQEWENTGLGYTTVLYENGSFKMVYQNNEYYPKFGYAVSSDGIHWTKSTANPIFTRDDTKNNWAPYGVAYPVLRKIGNEYRIYYSGAISSSYEWTIGYAVNAGLQ
jgi:predicted GH43/DUF377 family glycosyl hydrolase